MIDRTHPPKTSPLPPFKLPGVFETRLSNGLQVLLVEDRRFPLVAARLGFEAGSKLDPPEMAGLSESTGALLTEGTERRSARQIAEDVASLGAVLHADSNSDALVIAASALSENLPALIELMADVSRAAVFADEEVALRKQNRAQELLAQRSEAAFLADEKFAQVVYGPHPYSRQDPTLESIERLDRAAFLGFRDRWLVPNNAVLVLMGALPEPAATLELIERHWGGWQNVPIGEFKPPCPPEPRRCAELVDRPGSVQADIRIGRLAVTRAHPDYLPLLVANTILGGGASSRLFTNVREKQGYAYDVHSSLAPLKGAGTIAAVTQVRNEVLEPAIRSVMAEMRRIASEPVSAAELATAVNYLSGTFVMRLETLEGVAGQLVNIRLLGLPLDYLETYTTRLRAVTAAQVRDAAARYLRPDDASIVLVGDASRIHETRILETDL